MLAGFCLKDIESPSEMMMSPFVLKQSEKAAKLMSKTKDLGNLVLWVVAANLVLAAIV